MCSILVNKLPGSKQRLKEKKENKNLYDSRVTQYNQFFLKKLIFLCEEKKKKVLMFHFFLHARSKRKKKSEKEKGWGKLANEKTFFYNHKNKAQKVWTAYWFQWYNKWGGLYFINNENISKIQKTSHLWLTLAYSKVWMYAADPLKEVYSRIETVYI